MIPTTLRDSLLARLDRLGSMRIVAQIGAAIGRQFPTRCCGPSPALTRISCKPLSAGSLLPSWCSSEETPPDAVYAFKHALVQDAAHDSLLRSARLQLHAQIAEAIESLFRQLMETQPELFCPALY